MIYRHFLKIDRTALLFILILFLGFFQIYVTMAEGANDPPVEDYDVENWAWDTFPIIYIEPFDPNDDEKTKEYNNTIENSVKEWVSKSAVSWLTDDKNQANVIVHWKNDLNDLKKDCPNVGSEALACANKNNVYILRTIPPCGEITTIVAYNLALHEFGHVWGLGHSKNDNDIMSKSTEICNPLTKQFTSVKEDITDNRDKQMLNYKFKGFITDFGTGTNNNKLIVNYKLDSVLGDLKNVKIRLEYTIDGNGPYSIIRNREKDKSYTQILSELKKDTPFSTSYTTDKDIKDVKQVELGIYILDAAIPKKDTAKFVGYGYPLYDTTGKYYDKTIDLEPDKCYYCHAIEITECLENTPPGHNIRTSVSPNIEMAYETVITCGTTSSDRVSDFEINNYKVYAIYDISTTSLYSGNIEIMMSYSNFLLDNNDIRLLHYEGYWKDITASVDSSSRIITGNVNSLSLFAIVGKQKIIKGGIDLLTIIMIAIVLITISIIGIRKINKK